jgi:hypothetical protein
MLPPLIEAIRSSSLSQMTYACPWLIVVFCAPSRHLRALETRYILIRGYTYLPNMQYALDLWIVDGGCTFCSDGNL